MDKTILSSISLFLEMEDILNCRLVDRNWKCCFSESEKIQSLILSKLDPNIYSGIYPVGSYTILGFLGPFILFIYGSSIFIKKRIENDICSFGMGLGISSDVFIPMDLILDSLGAVYDNGLLGFRIPEKVSKKIFGIKRGLNPKVSRIIQATVSGVERVECYNQVSRNYTIIVKALSGINPITIITKKRYTTINEFYQTLIKSYPTQMKDCPIFPDKTWISGYFQKSAEITIQERKDKFQAIFDFVLKNNTLSRSPLVCDFLGS